MHTKIHDNEPISTRLWQKQADELKARSIECRTQTPMSDEEKFKEKRDGWVKEKILVVTPNQMCMLSNKEHEAVVNIGRKLYERT